MRAINICSASSVCLLPFSQICPFQQVLTAGLAAYVSWAPTLHSLPAGTPCVFTDHCMEAALRAAAMAEAVLEEPLSMPVCVNPFRRPASSQGRDNALPSFSNGFMFAVRLVMVTA